MSGSISTVIFDLDGTLVDSHPGIAGAFTKAMEECLPGSPVPDFARFIGPPVRQVFRQSLNCENPAVLDELNAAFRRCYDSECWKDSYLYEGTAALLQQLNRQGITCCVLTNKPAFATGKILEFTGIRTYFSHVLSPDDASPAFPSKTDAAHHLFREGQFDPGTTWLIGDSLDDAAAAAALGCWFASAGYGYGVAHTQDRYPVHARLGSLREFSAVIPPL